MLEILLLFFVCSGFFNFYCLFFHLSFLRCAEMELLVRSSADSGWQYSAVFEKSGKLHLI